MNISETTDKKDMTRWGLTLALGMLVLFWRIVLPTNMEITTGIVVLAVMLDLALSTAVVFLNRKELKEVFAMRFTFKDGLKTLVLIVVDFILGIGMVMISTTTGLPEGIMENAPAALIAAEFQAVFPIGAFISMVILAPIWEEIVFRLAGKNLFKNPILFVIITACLFAFIHTVNFSIVDNLFYLLSGVVYGVAYLIFKDIRILMIAHFFWNLIGGLGALLA